VRSGNHRGIVPTGETAQFVLAGNNLSERLAIAGRLAPGNRLDSHNILRLETLPPAEPPMSGRLLPDPEWVEYVTTGHVSTPRFSTDFPAEKLETDLSWDDLVLPGATLANVLEIESWLRHQYTLRHAWKLGARLKPGFRVLFHGPPGTGKTLCAALLGKRAGMPVFRIDLSMVISKYIGETEKNLSRLFDKAQDKQWILFFDEADALFGKRTDIRDAHDKYANQEVSYLLQRIEQFPGLVILASNFKTNLDDAFMRRFQTVVYFPMPRTDERLQLWLKSLPLQHAVLAPDVDLKHFAERYELSGAAILNATQYACLQALERNSNILTAADLTEGIRREFNKDGKPMP
jgi:SpoVK/Ycf46/Vps4 family AAA+-type ATPase